MLLFPQCLGICTDLKYHPPGAFFQTDLTYLLFGSSLSTDQAYHSSIQLQAYTAKHYLSYCRIITVLNNSTVFQKNNVIQPWCTDRCIMYFKHLNFVSMLSSTSWKKLRLAFFLIRMICKVFLKLKNVIRINKTSSKKRASCLDTLPLINLIAKSQSLQLLDQQHMTHKGNSNGL